MKLSLSNDSSKDESTLLNGNKPAIKEQEVKKSPPSAAHSRQSSQASTASMDMRPSRPTVGLGDCHKGLIVGLHRKMVIFSHFLKSRLSLNQSLILKNIEIISNFLENRENDATYQTPKSFKILVKLIYLQFFCEIAREKG